MPAADWDEPDEPRYFLPDAYVEPKADAAGVVGLVCGIVSLIAAFAVCVTCGFSAFLALPVSVVGLVFSWRGRGNFQATGLALNLLAFFPALAVVGFISWAMLKPRPDADGAPDAPPAAREPN